MSQSRTISQNTKKFNNYFNTLVIVIGKENKLYDYPLSEKKKHIFLFHLMRTKLTTTKTQLFVNKYHPLLPLPSLSERR